MSNINRKDIKSKSFNISELAIKRPVSTIMMMLTLVVVGLISYFRLNIELFPNVSFPVVAITTEYPGASSKEIETLVTKPIEDSISGINDLRHIRSTSGNGFSIVIVDFKLTKNVQTASDEVKEKVELVRSDLPLDIREPVVARFDPFSMPIISYGVSGKLSTEKLTEFVKEKLRPELLKVEGVANINIKGGMYKEVHILLDPVILHNFGITPESVVNRLKEENMDFPSGRIQSDSKYISLRTVSSLKNAEQTGNMKIKIKGDKTVYLKDLGIIKDGVKDFTTKAWFNNKPAIVLDIIRQSDANTVKTVEQLNKKFLQIKDKLPKGVIVSPSFDTSAFIIDIRDAGMEELISGSILATVVIFLFLRGIGGTLIAGLAIPTSVISTFTMLNIMGFSINMVTMMSLSLVVGVLVDDAVVDLENIYRRMELGEDPYTAAIRATDEIGLAVVATTFSIVAVFVPIAFMTGIVGQYFKQFGLTVSIAVLISLLVARTLTPTLAAHLLNPVRTKKELELKSRLISFYQPMLRFALKHRIITVLIALFMFLISIPISGLLPQGFIPKSDKDELTMSVKMSEGINIDKASEKILQISKVISEDKDVKEVLAVLGNENGQVDTARLNVAIFSKAEGRKGSGFIIQDRLREKIKKIPGCIVSIKSIDAFDDPHNTWSLNLSLRGEDLNELQVIADKLIKKLRTMPVVGVTDTSLGIPQTELHIVVDRDKASELGISSARIASLLRISTYGEVASKIRLDKKDIDIRVRLDEKSRNDVNVLKGLSLTSDNGKQIPLESIAKIKYSKGPTNIERFDRDRQVMVFANTISGVSLSEIIDPIKEELEKMRLPKDITYSFEGDAELMADTFNAMFMALATSVLFIYIILASQFESFVHPVTIMIALPLSFIGAFLALFLTNHEIGLFAFIGIVLLMGLVTKNSILLVDYTIKMSREGMNRLDALVQAGTVRMRPILMTTFAMISGMMPVALQMTKGSEGRSSMAIAVIGGVITSTLLSLIVVPVFYTLMDDLARFFTKHSLEEKE